MICRLGELKTAGDEFWSDIKLRYADRQIDRFRPILPPENVFISTDDIFRKLKAFPQIEIKEHTNAVSLASAVVPDLNSNARLARPFLKLEEFIEQQHGRILFCAETAGRRETLLELLKQIDIHPDIVEHWQDFRHSKVEVGLCVAPLDQGLWLPDEKLILIAESQLFGERIAQRRR